MLFTRTGADRKSQKRDGTVKRRIFHYGPGRSHKLYVAMPVIQDVVVRFAKHPNDSPRIHSSGEKPLRILNGRFKRTCVCVHGVCAFVVTRSVFVHVLPICVIKYVDVQSRSDYIISPVNVLGQFVLNDDPVIKLKKREEKKRSINKLNNYFVHIRNPNPPLFEPHLTYPRTSISKDKEKTGFPFTCIWCRNIFLSEFIVIKMNSLDLCTKNANTFIFSINS